MAVQWEYLALGMGVGVCGCGCPKLLCGMSLSECHGEGMEGFRVWGVALTGIKDFKFVPLMFVTLGFRSQIPLFRTIFRALRTQNPREQT